MSGRLRVKERNEEYRWLTVRRDDDGVVRMFVPNGAVKTSDGWVTVPESKLDDVVWDFASTLKQLRESAGISIADLATAAGMTRQAVDLLERGERQPSLETAERLAIALGKKLRVFEGCGIPESV